MITTHRIAATLIGTAIAAGTLGIGLAAPAIAAPAGISDGTSQTSVHADDDGNKNPYGGYQNPHRKHGGNRN